MEQDYKELTIVDIINDKVQEIAKAEYGDDKESPPLFIVSLYNEGFEKQSIMLTISHMGDNFTKKLFPKQIGYDVILEVMQDLYNETTY